MTTWQHTIHQTTTAIECLNLSIKSGAITREETLNALRNNLTQDAADSLYALLLNENIIIKAAA